MRLGLLGTVPGLSPEVRPELRAHLADSVELSAWPSRVGVFPSTPVERLMQAVGHVEAGLRAARDGVDALAIDSIGDYGLEALRAAVGIPVIGAGEAGMAAAARIGRFGIVTVWPASMNFIPEDLLQAYGRADQCIGIWNVGDEAVIETVAGPDGYLDRVNRAEPSILQRIFAKIEAAVADGAAVIMLGCTCMSPMARQIAAAVQVPIVNPLAEAAMLAVSAAGSRSSGASVRTDRADLLTRMVNAVADGNGDSCPVCIVSDTAAGPTA